MVLDLGTLHRFQMSKNMFQQIYIIHEDISEFDMGLSCSYVMSISVFDCGSVHHIIGLYFVTSDGTFMTYIMKLCNNALYLQYWIVATNRLLCGKHVTI